MRAFIFWFLLNQRRVFAELNPVDFFDFGNVLSLVIYRKDFWQVELMTIRPGPGFPREHRHPDVDSAEYVLSGDAAFLVNGKVKTTDEPGLPKPLYNVTAEDWHGVGLVTRASTFLSIQKWNNGVEPSSVGLNWEGTPTSVEQKALLKTHPAAKWIRTVRKHADAR